MDFNISVLPTQSFDNNGDRRTAQATPGQLKKHYCPKYEENESSEQ